MRPGTYPAAQPLRGRLALNDPGWLTDLIDDG